MTESQRQPDREAGDEPGRAAQRAARRGRRRADPYRPMWVGIFLFTGLVALVGISRLRMVHDAVPWREDLAAGRAEAAAGHKRVLVCFTANWCEACEVLHRETWADERVAAALGDVVPVKVDVDRWPEVAREYHVEAIPRVMLLGEDGRVVRSFEGVVTAEEFIRWLKG